MIFNIEFRVHCSMMESGLPGLCHPMCWVPGYSERLNGIHYLTCLQEQLLSPPWVDFIHGMVLLLSNQAFLQMIHLSI